MGKRTPNSDRNRNKRPGSNSDNKEESPAESVESQPNRRENGSSATRERSASKKRKTSEQQHKITSYTSSQSGAEGGRTEMRQTSDNHNSAVMSTLDRMEKGIEDGRKQTEKVNTQLEKVISEIFEIRRENTYLRKKVESLEKKCSDLSDEVDRLEKHIKQEKELRNLLEQYTRKDNIKLINLPGDSPKETAEDTETKVLHFIQNKLKVPSFLTAHISIAHRVGKFTSGQNRPVIVRLTTRRVKTEIFRQRKVLKQEKSNIFINEDLTKLNSQRLMQMKHHPAVLAAWSFQGKLYCKLLDLRIINIEEGDMTKIDRSLLDSPAPNHAPQSHQIRSLQHQDRDQGQPTARGGRGRGTGRGGSRNQWTAPGDNTANRRSVRLRPALGSPPPMLAQSLNQNAQRMEPQTDQKGSGTDAQTPVSSGVKGANVSQTQEEPMLVQPSTPVNDVPVDDMPDTFRDCDTNFSGEEDPTEEIKM